jgi:uncharacterized protein (DUF433 family)
MMSQTAQTIRYPYIHRDPAILGGKPVVEGTRLAVSTLVRAHQQGMEFDEVLVQYPHLTAQGLHAAMLYYLDHQDEIDAIIDEAQRPPPGATIAEP